MNNSTIPESSYSTVLKRKPHERIFLKDYMYKSTKFKHLIAEIFFVNFVLASLNLFLTSNAAILPPMSMKENTQKAA
jgi:hypothetical protein